MNSLERARAELATYQDLKRAICAQEGAPDDCVAMLTVMFADGGMAVAALAAGHPTDQIVFATRLIREHGEKAHGPLVHLAVASEGYVAISTDPATPDPPRGALSQAFGTDPTSGVREALIVTVLSPSMGTGAMVR